MQTETLTKIGVPIKVRCGYRLGILLQGVSRWPTAYPRTGLMKPLIVPI